MNGADLAVLVVPFLDGSSNRVEAGTDLEDWISSSTPSSFKSRCKKEEENLHSFVVASFNAQSVKGNDMACKRCEISTFLEDNGVDLFFY